MPSHGKEIYEFEEYIETSLEEVSEEINGLNKNLHLLSITLLKIMSKSNANN